jgi:hypothetical protein
MLKSSLPCLCMVDDRTSSSRLEGADNCNCLEAWRKNTGVDILICNSPPIPAPQRFPLPKKISYYILYSTPKMLLEWKKLMQNLFLAFYQKQQELLHISPFINLWTHFIVLASSKLDFFWHFLFSSYAERGTRQFEWIGSFFISLVWEALWPDVLLLVLIDEWVRRKSLDD